MYEAFERVILVMRKRLEDAEKEYEITQDPIVEEVMRSRENVVRQLEIQAGMFKD